MKSITSISGGKTSAYMAIHYPTDYYLFAIVLNEDPLTAPKDPGVLRECRKRIPGFIGSSEVEITLKNLLYTEEILGKPIDWVCAYESQHKPSFKSDVKGWLPKPLTFDRLISAKNSLPNKSARWCTIQLKIYAIYWHTYLHIMEEPDSVVFMNIGFRSDEPLRVKKAKDCKKNRIRAPRQCHMGGRQKWLEHEWRVQNFPLYDNGITHEDVKLYWADKPFQWPEVSNCAHCFWHTDLELQKVESQYPNFMNWAKQQELRVGASWDKKGDIDHRLAHPVKRKSLQSCGCTD